MASGLWLVTAHTLHAKSYIVVFRLSVVIEHSRHLAELRNMVTSPGGTSAAAIYQLEKGSLRTVLSKAVYAAHQRAVELGALTEKKLANDE